MATPYDTITSDPQRRGGRPCVRDLRITAGDVFGWLASGQNSDQIVANYPELTPADIRACLALSRSTRVARGPARRCVKLLLDENLSRRLFPALQTRFPGSDQVALPGLERATDIELCD